MPNEYTSIKMETQNAELTIKKHWVNYEVPVTLTLIGIGMASASSFIKYFGYALVMYNLLRIYSISTVKWRLTRSELNISRGMLPWTKNLWQVPIFDIYESTVSYGLFGHILGYGNINVRRTEGVTSVICGSTLAGAKAFSSTLNGLVRDFKTSKNTIVMNQSAGSKTVSDQLVDLADLKSKGELTQQEFDQMKKRLLENF